MPEVAQSILNFYRDRDFERSRRFASGQYSPQYLRDVLTRWDNPQLAYKTIHVAGTVGKGSVTRLLARMLAIGDGQVGCYTSPHLNALNERIAVGDEPIADVDLGRLWLELQKIDGFDRLSFFDAITALAFAHFRQCKVNWAVIETGLGGRMDSTNNLRPEFTVFSLIDYDHQAILGETLAEIATEKAGIMKPGAPAYSMAQPPEAAMVLAETAGKRGCPLHSYAEAPAGDFADYNHRFASWVFSEHFGQPAPQVSAKVTGVVEQLAANPEIWFDAGHTPAAATAISRWLSNQSSRHWNIYINTMKERALESLLDPLRSIRERIDLRIYLVETDNELLHRSGDIDLPDVTGIMSLHELKEPDRAHLFFGSHYLYEIARKMIVQLS